MRRLAAMGGLLVAFLLVAPVIESGTHRPVFQAIGLASDGAGD
jgi:hypothetical protein